MYDVNFGGYGVKAISSIKDTNMDVDFTNSFWDSSMQKEYGFDEGDPITVKNLQTLEADLVIDEDGIFREYITNSHVEQIINMLPYEIKKYYYKQVLRYDIKNVPHVFDLPLDDLIISSGKENICIYIEFNDGMTISINLPETPEEALERMETFKERYGDVII